MNRLLHTCLFAGLGLLSSCHTGDTQAPYLGLDYFPLRVGAYVIYEVDETQYNQVNGDVQSLYELKVTVMDSVQNQEGGYTYTLLRQKRTDNATTWSNLSTWTARVNGRQGIVAEENTSFVKLVFPPSNGVSWNGNAYNLLGGDEQCDAAPCDSYLLQSLDEPFNLSGTVFEHTLTILQQDNPDRIVKQDIRKEVYARNVGLIYREATVLNYCTKADCLGDEIVETGYRYTQTLKEYGG